MGPAKSKPSDKALAPDPFACLPHVQREASSLREKEAALEMEFMLQAMQLKEFAAEGNNLERLLQRADNSSFEDRHKGLTLPLDNAGFVQSFQAHERDAIANFFQLYGLVVIKNAIDHEACDRSVAEVWDFLEHDCKGLDRADPSTWGTWPSLWKLGILSNTFLLSPQLCENRQAPDVHRAFAAVFGTERLIVNVGRASAMRPTRDVPQRQATGEVQLVDLPEWKSAEGSDWLHWDMNPFTGFASTFSWRVHNVFANCGYSRLRVQGILALMDCRAEDGGFFCVPGSHHVIRGWAHRNNTMSDSKLASPESSTQLHLPKDDPLKQHAQKAPIRRGDLLIWDAKLAHCNFPNDSSSMRMVQYIQMAEADDPVFGVLCSKEGYLPPVDKFELSQLGSKLYGFRSWD